MVEETEILEARQQYFDTLNQKNNIDHTRIDQLDLDNIGIVLNYQQVDLIKIALTSNKINYKEYQNQLIKINDVITEKGKKERWITVLKRLIEDELPDKTKEVITRIYEQTRVNANINSLTIEDVLNKLISKLSTDLQDTLYQKINKLGQIEKEGIRDMSMEEALKLLSYIEHDYTSITINEEANFNNYVNPNGSYNKDNLKSMLDFAYDNDKEVIIGSLISGDIPNHLKDCSKETIKQKLIVYIDEITKYFNIYNSIHERTDRKPVIRALNMFNELENNEWLKVLSMEDFCDIVKLARKNLPDIAFCYNENELEKKSNRTKLMSHMVEIMQYEKKHRVKLVNLIGTEMHVDLDVLKDDIVEMFQDLSDFNLPIAITEFDVSPNEDMLFNNSRKEIEILRERYISDFCNIITNLTLSKIVTIDSVNIDSVCDNQSHRLTIVNEKRRRKKEPLFKTLYSGMYDSNMNRKENLLIRKRKKNNSKGFAETMYVGTIVFGLLIVVAIVILIFLRYVQ